MKNTLRRGLHRIAQRCFIAVALVCGGYTLVAWAQARAAAHASLQLAAMPVASAESPDARVIGRLDIPALKLTVPILSNDDADSLKRGVGHIPGTALPGGLGTVGLAGHRDMFLRPLRNIRKGMDVRLVVPAGTYDYAVDSTEIVLPADVRVLDIGDRPELTLITCYPFFYVGSAPQRFIVHAHLVSALPD